MTNLLAGMTTNNLRRRPFLRPANHLHLRQRTNRHPEECDDGNTETEVCLRANLVRRLRRFLQRSSGQTSLWGRHRRQPER